MGCRDCPRCTESFVTNTLLLPLRFLWALLTAWNISLFRRKCPQCGHYLSIHQRIAGRYVD